MNLQPRTPIKPANGPTQTKTASVLAQQPALSANAKMKIWLADVSREVLRGRQFLRFARFVIVGLLSAFAYVLAMALAVDGMHLPVVAATVAAFVAGTVVSYSGHTRWTFEAPLTSRNLARFLIVTFLGLGISVTIAWALNAIGIHYLLISCTILVLIPIWNFVAHKYWTYQ